MKIRAMKREDYARTYSLWLSCSGMGLNDADDGEEGFCRFLLRNPATCFVAEEGGETVGAVMVGTDGRRAYLYHLAVACAFRRRGVGSSLVAAAINALDGLGIRKAALVVFARNTEAIKFWESLGFAARGDLNYMDKEMKSARRIDT